MLSALEEGSWLHNIHSESQRQSLAQMIKMVNHGSGT